jgi:metal-dependent amidase/aminoacylase/carboxypeptidase family protein
VDTIAMAGTLISSLQSLVSRKVSPLDPAVLTFGSIHGGSAHNIISDNVDIVGTLRTTDPDTREMATTYIEQQVKYIAEAYGGKGKVVFLPGYDALINPQDMVDQFVAVAEPIIGADKIQWKDAPGMGVEDFSYFLNEASGLFYHLGSGNKKLGITAPLHSREFDIDESCLALGVNLQMGFALSLLQKK